MEHHRREVLRGAFMRSSAEVMPMKSSMLIYVSCPVGDLMDERKLLAEDIARSLYSEGMKNDIEVIIIDPTFGMTEEDLLNSHTWNELYYELDWCRHESSGLFFLSLQSEQYGVVTLPSAIRYDVLDKRLQKCDNKAKNLVHSVYYLDSNAIPRQYVMNNINVLLRDSNRNETITQLLRILKDIPCYVESEYENQTDGNTQTDNTSTEEIVTDSPVLVGRSINEWEVNLAMLSELTHHRCKWITTRKSTGNDNEMVITNGYLTESNSKPEEIMALNRSNSLKLENLKKRMSSSLLLTSMGKCQVHCIDTTDTVADTLPAEEIVSETDSDESDNEELKEGKQMSLNEEQKSNPEPNKPELSSEATPEANPDMKAEVEASQTVNSQTDLAVKSDSNTLLKIEPNPATKLESIPPSKSEANPVLKSKENVNSMPSNQTISTSASSPGGSNTYRGERRRSSVKILSVKERLLKKWETDVRRILLDEIEMLAEKREDWNSDAWGIGICGADLEEMLHHSEYARKTCSSFFGRDSVINQALEIIYSPNRFPKPNPDEPVEEQSKSPISSKVEDNQNRRDSEEDQDKIDAKSKLSTSIISTIVLSDEDTIITPLTSKKRSSAESLRSLLSADSSGVDYDDNRSEGSDGGGGQDGASSIKRKEGQEPPKEVESGLDGITLALIGHGGHGKTGLMAKLAQLAYEREGPKGRPVIVRFCGTTSRCRDGLSLIRGISQQIELIYGHSRHRRSSRSNNMVPFHGVATNSSVSPLQETQTNRYDSNSYAKAVSHLHKLLKKHPVILFLNRIDLLSDTFLARSRISYLMNVVPHKNTRIIVSCLPDVKDATKRNWIYSFGCSTRLKEWNVPMINISKLDTGGNGLRMNEALFILERMLTQRKRCLNEQQWAYVKPFINNDPTPLYLTLVCKTISMWTSAAYESSLVLKDSLEGMFNFILDGLEKKFTKDLTRSAIGFITFSLEGIRHSEMLDLLTLDEKVMKHIRKKIPNAKRIPSHHWLRLQRDLVDLMNFRSGGCICWGHSKLLIIAKERYSVEECLYFYTIMGKYFSNMINREDRKDLIINYQPITYTERNPWYFNAKINRRRCVESSYHLTHVEMIEEAVAEICDYEIICARIRFGYLDKSIVFLSRILEKLKGDEIIRRESLSNLKSNDLNAKLMSIKFTSTPNLYDKVDHYIRLFRNILTTTTLASIPRIFACATEMQSCNSIARMELFDYFMKTKGTFIDRNKSFSYGSWIRGLVLGGRDKVGPLCGTLIGQSSGVRSISWNHDGSRLVSGSDGNTLRVWDVVSGFEVIALHGHLAEVTCVCFAPDGKQIVSGSDDETLRIWDAINGDEIACLKGHTDCITSVSWSGKRIASGSWDETVRVWDSSAGFELVTLRGHFDCIRSVAFCPDGKRVASGSYDNTIRIWDSILGTQLQIIEAHNDYVTAVAWFPNGHHLITGSADTTVRVWDSVTCVELVVLYGHTEGVKSVVSSPDGSKIASASLDETVRIWDVSTRKELAKLQGHTHHCTTVAWCDTGHLIASGSTDKQICIWDTSRVSNAIVYHGHVGAVTNVKWNREGTKILSASWDKTLCIWDADSYSLIHTLRGHTDCVRSGQWSPNCSQIVSGSHDTTIRMWDASTGLELYCLTQHTSWVTGVGFSKDGLKLLSSSSDTSVFIWDIATKSVIMKITGHPTLVMSAKWNPSGSKIMTCSADKTIRIFSADKGHKVAQIVGPDNLRSVSWSNNGAKIGAGTNIVVLYDDRFISQSLILPGCDDKTIRIWDSETYEELLVIRGHQGWVRSISWTKDGSRIASGSADKTIRIWRESDGLQLSVLYGHSNWVYCVAWSYDYQRIVSGSDDSTVRIWDSVPDPEEKQISDHPF